jgi:glutathione synthase/RimK-type ligase-like ATP-grasp enzyme
MGQETYVWYSPATDVTGKKLMEALGASGGTAKPAAGKENVVCWGTKTDAAVLFGAATKLVLNHPDKIRVNRDKVNALTKLKQNQVSVAPYTENFKLAGTKDYPFPVVCRTKFHQGGAGFWLCLNEVHVAQAVKEGANYLQNYINIQDEYRLHVVKNKVIYAVRKVQRDNHAEAFVEHYGELVAAKALKGAVNLDKNTMDFVLKKLAAKFANGTDMIIRSNTRGWKFSRVANENLNNTLVTEAVNAVKALGLDYAAVDCCLDTTGKAYVIECNSGPGLDGNSFDSWVAAFKELLAPPAAKKVAAAPVEQKIAAPKVAAKAVGGKAKLQEKLALLAQLADLADDDEAAVLHKLINKM